jgi:cation transport regulator ChaB
MPITSEKDLPGPLQRSPRKAQRTYAEALESAEKQYDDPERAHRVVYTALKHSFKKVGDRWEPKSRKGPSDPQAAKGEPEARRRPSKTYGGVDVKSQTKDELLEDARRLDIKGRSKMTKDELGEAIAKASRREDARRRRSRS